MRMLMSVVELVNQGYGAQWNAGRQTITDRDDVMMSQGDGTSVVKIYPCKSDRAPGEKWKHKPKLYFKVAPWGKFRLQWGTRRAIHDERAAVWQALRLFRDRCRESLLRFHREAEWRGTWQDAVARWEFVHFALAAQEGRFEAVSPLLKARAISKQNPLVLDSIAGPGLSDRLGYSLLKRDDGKHLVIRSLDAANKPGAWEPLEVPEAVLRLIKRE